MKKIRYIDLFAGAGGLSEGFIRQGYLPMAHVEMDKAACYTLKTRIAYYYLKSTDQINIYNSYLKGEISRNIFYSYVPEKLLDSVINLPIGKEYNAFIHSRIKKQIDTKSIDLIIGGPPCQAYSLVGRARSEDGMRTDPRNHLYVEYANYLEQYQPKVFLFENVLGLTSAKKGQYLKNMEKLFNKKGYKIKLFKLTASNFGVLQNRKRIIIIGWSERVTEQIPDLESILNISEYKVDCIFKDLPELKAGEGIDRYQNYKKNVLNEYLKSKNIRNGIDILTQHVCRPHTNQDKEIYRLAVEKWNNNKERIDYNDLPENLKTHKNRHSFFDRFKVVAGDLNYSHTVVAHIAKDGHYYIHPDVSQNRSISVREAARLQSFPDDYFFEGVKENQTRTSAFKQIGNAVPPLMAEEIAKVIRKLF